MSTVSITKKSLLQFSLFTAYVVTCQTVYAQFVNNPPLKFDHYNYEQGMSAGSIRTVFKDSKGFVWVVTTGGINRYDGNEFKIFRNDASDSTTISNGLPSAITEDKNGIIWIANDIPYGLNAYDPVTGKFKQYCKDPLYINKLPKALVRALFVDSNNVLWICARGEGVYSWDLKTNAVVHFEYDPKDPASLPDNNIINGLVLSETNILFYSEKRIGIYNKYTKQFTNYYIDPDSKISLGAWRPGVFYDNNKNLCIPADEGIVVLGVSMSSFIEYPTSLVRTLKNSGFKSLLVLPDGRIWINSNSGLFAFDPITKSYSVYKNDPYDTYTISRDMFEGFIYDHSGVIWIWGGYGVNKVSAIKEKFQIINNPEKENILGGPVEANVRRSFRDRTGQIFQTNPKGVFTFNFTTKQFIPFVPDEYAGKYLNGHDVQFVFQDKTGSYWFGVDDSKLIVYDPGARSWKVWMPTESHYFNYPGDYNFQSVYQDTGNNIWFAGAHSVCRYNPQTRKFKEYFIDSVNKKNTINSVDVIMEPGDGNVWFGSTGLYRYNAKEDLIEYINFRNSKDAIILSNSKITYALKADSSRMWIGTDGSGLFLLDFLTKNCKRVSTSDGLPNDRIFALSKDVNGALWVSTDGGLCRYVPYDNIPGKKGAGTFKTYTAHYTWPVQGFSGPGGEMYFQMFGTTGLLYFDPDSLGENHFVPQVYITDFKLLNRSVQVGDSTGLLDSTIFSKKRIVLDHDQNVISFTFAALSFVNSESNQYAYRLLGFNKEWIYTNASNRIASYTNLNPGEYTFEVKASNNDGVWSNTPARIILVITPPWWQTWWFRILAITVLAGITYAFYRFRITQVRKEEQVRRRLASDLHDDIGSTLSSISYYSEAIRKQVKDAKSEVIPLLEKMEKASENTIDAMSDIVWAINPELDKGANLVSRMHAYAAEMTGLRNIKLDFEAGPSFERSRLSMDKKKNIYLIFKEAVNNAVKYAGCKNIGVSLSVDGDRLEMQVTDDGKGFDDTNEASGNGLKNMRLRAKEIKATLEIRSAENQGCSVILKL